MSDQHQRKERGLNLTLKPRGLKDTYFTIYIPGGDEVQVKLEGFRITGGIVDAANVNVVAPISYLVLRQKPGEEPDDSKTTTSRELLREAVELLGYGADCEICAFLDKVEGLL
jgi:hypothetical protein